LPAYLASIPGNTCSNCLQAEHIGEVNFKTIGFGHVVSAANDNKLELNNITIGITNIDNNLNRHGFIKTHLITYSLKLK